MIGWELGVGSAVWSPDGRKLAMARADLKGVPQIPIQYSLGPTEEVKWFHASRPGQPALQLELFVVDISSQQRIRIDTGDKQDQKIVIIGWRPDGAELLFESAARNSPTGGPTKMRRLLAANPTTGATRVILVEDNRAHFVTFVDDGKKFIWASERDGWNHLYLYDLDGTLIRRLTTGAFPVLAGAHAWVPQIGVVAVDEDAGWIYLRAQGDKHRPYDVHLYRVMLDGTGFARLTEQPGWHDIQFAPSNEFFLDTHSSVNRPPVVELRRADSQLLQTLSRTNSDAIRASGWVPPEEFVVKAADGTTDLYGVLYKPPDFDPNKKYPVIEWIYAGPWTTVVPRRFTDYAGVEVQSLAHLGAVVFVVDARGTPGRDREFQDVVVGNLGRHEIPDHVATLRQLAEEHDYMDTNRVGVFGGSWGGYFALRAMLLAPDVYHVGVAVKPARDIADYYADYIEPYMGLPKSNPEGYAYGSNTRLVQNLKGKLLLIHGTGDAEAPFSGTMKMVDALMQAGKYFDLIVVPDENHFPMRGRHAEYLREAIRRHFQKHLEL